MDLGKKTLLSCFEKWQRPLFISQKTTAATWSVNKIIPVSIALPVSPNMSQSQYDL